MQDIIREASEEIAYNFINRRQPNLLIHIKLLLASGLKPGEIVDFCAERVNAPRHRLEYIGCAADFVIRQKSSE